VSTPKPKILVIEDNPDTRKFLEVMLSKEFEVFSAEDGIIGIDYARNKAPDLILLDIMLPVLSGYDTCSLLRKDEKTKDIPIIFLSAKNTVNDITQGLSQGADDYLPKPFDYKELQARIRARLRRSMGGAGAGTGIIQVGDLKIDQNLREVSFEGKKATLTLTEFDILKYMATRVGIEISRDDILKEVWKDDATETNDRTIDVHIRSLRKKIPGLTKHILSIYGIGYKYQL
jgi:two-component system alkaline phosphatase synthesis response regulator PhoP